MCQRGKLPVALIEVREFVNIGEIFIFTCVSHRQMYSLDASWGAVEDLEIEPIADSGLAMRLKVPMIFGHDGSGEVHDDAAMCEYLLKKLDYCQSAFERWFLAIAFKKSAVSDDRHVGIDGQTAY